MSTPSNSHSTAFLEGACQIFTIQSSLQNLRGATSSLHHPFHTPSIAFRHLPPNSARFGYATEGALFISPQLSTDAVSALRKVWVLI